MNDMLGRKINYLRLSVTDRCNLRCKYCMPASGIRKRAHEETLSYEQLYRIVKAAVSIGVEKIRVTGGEPLVRKGIIGFLAQLKQIPGLKRLVLTTNGTLLEEMAEDLVLAGVESVNVSLDSLRSEVFYRITRGGDLHKVLSGINAAGKAGFKHLKINTVVMRGVNEKEVLDFAAMTMDAPLDVRFIEYMPTLKEEDWGSRMVSGEELLATISKRYRVQKVANESLGGPAAYHRIQGAQGKLGFITPVSSHFCGECNRIRVTSSGMVKSCLFDAGTVSLRPYLKRGDDIGLEQILSEVVRMKPRGHSLTPLHSDNVAFRMSEIGG